MRVTYLHDRAATTSVVLGGERVVTEVEPRGQQLCLCGSGSHDAGIFRNSNEVAMVCCS